MGLTETISELQASDWEKGSEFAAKLTADLKNLETVNQKKLSDLIQQSETILAVAGAEGADFSEKLVDAGKKISQLDARNKELEQTVSSFESELTEIKQSQLLSEVGQKSGVNTKVLKTLLREDDEVKVDGDKVTVNGTEIKDWAQNNQSDFMTSLFPKTSADIDLPGGGSKISDLPPGGSKGEDQSDKEKPKALQQPHAAERAQVNIDYWNNK